MVEVGYFVGCGFFFGVFGICVGKSREWDFGGCELVVRSYFKVE